jgi:hypothetical protein
MTDLCLEATQTTGPVSLFIGIESAGWNEQEFTDVGQFAKSHGITCIFLKCFEVGSKEGDVWYGGMNGIDANINLIKAEGVACIPYGFLYGDTFGNLSKEIDVAKQLLSNYGVLCLDMEGSYWANQSSAGWANQIATALQTIPGQLWVSCVANPVDAGQLPFLQAMLPATNVFMPMVYSDYLATKYEADFKRLGATCAQPTIDLSGEFGPNNVPAIVAQIVTSGAQALSMWEYQSAQQYASTLDQVMSLFSGGNQQGEGTVQLNSQGCVCDVAASYQLESGESQDLCGPWSVASLKYAGMPGKGATGTAEQIDQDADKEADAWLSGGHTGALGSSIENMHEFFHAAGNLHYWDMANPSIDNIRKAVQAGYPVLITANEQNIIEKKTGKRPYPWNLNTNHVLPVTGIDKDGDFVCPDQLNNSFQGYWPVVYLASKINPSWATAVQLVGPDASKPWLKQVPSDDPSTWPSGFNAQNFVAPAPPPPPAQDYKAEAFAAEWTSIVPGLPIDSPIAQLAYEAYWTDGFHGPATSKEFQLFQKDGSEKVAQTMLMGIYIWDLKTSTGKYYPYH